MCAREMCPCVRVGTTMQQDQRAVCDSVSSHYQVRVMYKTAITSEASIVHTHTPALKLFLLFIVAGIEPALLDYTAVEAKSLF